MSKMDIYNALKTTPAEARKTISGGRLNGFTDINPMYRIRALTEQFGPCGIGWYYNIEREWTESAGDELLAFVDISLYIKIDEWSKPIHGTGGSMLLVKESKGLRANDEAYKMATTDALSVACKQLGIGADIYWEKGESKYGTQVDKTAINAEILSRGQQIDSLISKFNMSREDYATIAKVTKAKSPRDMTGDEFAQHLAFVQQRFEAAK